MSDPRIIRPDRSNPREFSRRVAEAYREAVAGGAHKPAKMIADSSGVPVATVHRWIGDARRRGLLPPGRQGVAGESTVLERVAAEISVSPDVLLAALRKHGRPLVP